MMANANMNTVNELGIFVRTGVCINFFCVLKIEQWFRSHPDHICIQKVHCSGIKDNEGKTLYTRNLLN